MNYTYDVEIDNIAAIMARVDYQFNGDFFNPSFTYVGDSPAFAPEILAEPIADEDDQNTYYYNMTFVGPTISQSDLRYSDDFAWAGDFLKRILNAISNISNEKFIPDDYYGDDE